MSAQTQVSVKRIMERAYALKQRLSNASDHSSGSFYTYAQNDYPSETQPKPMQTVNVPSVVATQPPILYSVKPRYPKVLVYPIQDYPFLCLCVVSNFSCVEDLSPLAPTGVVRDVFVRISASPLQHTNSNHVLFDFTYIYQISLMLVAEDEQYEFVLATAPILTSEQLSYIFLNESGKRKFSRKCVSLAFKYTVYLKSTAQTADAVGSLPIAVADVIILCGGNKLLELDASLKPNLTCVQQFRKTALQVEDFSIQTEQPKAELPDPMRDMRKVGKVQIVLRIGGVSINCENYDEFSSVYVSCSLQPDTKFYAATGVQAKVFRGIPQNSSISKQFPLLSKGYARYSELSFNIGKTLSLTPDTVAYISKGSIYVALFGIMKSGRKAFLGCSQLPCAQCQPNWVGFARGSGYVYCDAQVIRGNDMQDFTSYEKLISLKGLPAEYEMAYPAQRNLEYKPFVPYFADRSAPAQFLRSRELNPQLSRVAPLREAGGFADGLNEIMGVGRRIEQLFDDE